jgi:hypothetical protein
MSRIGAEVVTGSRGAIVPGVNPVGVMDPTISDAVINKSFEKPGILYYSDSPNEWLIVRNVAPLVNANGEIVREALRVELKFEDKLYFLEESDPFYEEKKKYIEKLPWYGSRIRPMSEISREARSKAQSEAIKTLASLSDTATATDVIKQLAAKFDMTPEVKATLDQVLAEQETKLGKPKVSLEIK